MKAPRHMGRIVDPDVEENDSDSVGAAVSEPVAAREPPVEPAPNAPFPGPPPPPPDGTALLFDETDAPEARAEPALAAATAANGDKPSSVIPRPNEFEQPDDEDAPEPIPDERDEDDESRDLDVETAAAVNRESVDTNAASSPPSLAEAEFDELDSMEISFHTSAAAPVVAVRPQQSGERHHENSVLEHDGQRARRSSERPSPPASSTETTFTHGADTELDSSQALTTRARTSPLPGDIPEPATRRSGHDFSADGFVDALNDDQRDSTSFRRTGHPVRDRLLAKAAQAQAAKAAATRPSDDLPGLSRLEVVSSELDEIAAPKMGNGSAPLRIAGTTLSSSSLLIFGSLCGMAAIVSLFTFLIQFAPRDQAVPVPGATPPPPAAMAPAATPQTTAVAHVEPPPERRKIPGPWRIGRAGAGQKKITGSIGREPFLKAIQAAGISKNQAYRIYAALKDERDLDHCRPKDDFVALLEGDRAVAFEYIVSKEEVYQAREDKQGRLIGKKLDLQVRKQRVQGSLTVTSSSFADVARAAHLEPALGRVLDRALEGHTNVGQFQLGDRLRVVAQEVTVLGEFYRYAGLEALEYIPANGSPLRVYYFNKKKKYYDSKGRAPGEGGWRKPLKGAPITSKFNPNRLHPILKKRMPHNGTDFGAPTGTPVYASSYGTITKRGDYGPNGNFIAIQHDHGYETGYSHLSRFEEGLKVGDKVKRMQVIGYVGSTGRSTGPHLHFSAKKNGAFIDPESLHLDALSVLPPEDRSDFAKVKAQYDEMLEAVALPPPLAAPAPPVATQPETIDMGEDESPVDGEMHDEAQMGSPVPQPVAPVVGLAPTQPAVAPPAPAAAPAAQAVGASLYLSDEELMKSQSASDEGEVEE